MILIFTESEKIDIFGLIPLTETFTRFICHFTFCNLYETYTITIGAKSSQLIANRFTAS